MLSLIISSLRRFLLVGSLQLYSDRSAAHLIILWRVSRSATSTLTTYTSSSVSNPLFALRLCLVCPARSLAHVSCFMLQPFIPVVGLRGDHWDFSFYSRCPLIRGMLRSHQHSLMLSVWKDHVDDVQRFSLWYVPSMCIFHLEALVISSLNIARAQVYFSAATHDGVLGCS